VEVSPLTPGSLSSYITQPAQLTYLAAVTFSESLKHVRFVWSGSDPDCPDAGGYLSFYELMVWAGGSNAAQGKTATGSAVIGGGHDAAKGVDGLNTTGYHSANVRCELSRPACKEHGQ
jgi:hypothetical protein